MLGKPETQIDFAGLVALRNVLLGSAVLEQPLNLRPVWVQFALPDTETISFWGLCSQLH